MPSKPKAPTLPPPNILPTQIQGSQLEGVRNRERDLLKKRRGYASTIATRGGLGDLSLGKARALGA